MVRSPQSMFYTDRLSNPTELRHGWMSAEARFWYQRLILIFCSRRDIGAPQSEKKFVLYFTVFETPISLRCDWNNATLVRGMLLNNGLETETLYLGFFSLLVAAVVVYFCYN